MTAKTVNVANVEDVERAESEAVRPYRVDVAQADLDDLAARLERTRFADEIPGSGAE